MAQPLLSVCACGLMYTAVDSDVMEGEGEIDDEVKGVCGLNKQQDGEGKKKEDERHEWRRLERRKGTLLLNRFPSLFASSPSLFPFSHWCCCTAHHGRTHSHTRSQRQLRLLCSVATASEGNNGGVSRAAGKNRRIMGRRA